MKSSKNSTLIKSRKLKPSQLQGVYNKLLNHFGHQGWWPGDTPFEIIIGAILTQNTAWINVEKAILNLKKAKVLRPKVLHALSNSELSRLIKPAGYFNVKTKRIKNFLAFLSREYNYSIKAMSKEKGPILRAKLLEVNGIGPETADSILLYATGKPIFVIDAYTKRIFSRHKLLSASNHYEHWQKLMMNSLPQKLDLFNDFHAQIVTLAKTHCQTTAQCSGCPLECYL